MSTKINLWVDDERDPLLWRAGETWTWVKDAHTAIAAIDSGVVCKVSLDHDLGPDEAGTGYLVALHIESLAASNSISKIEWAVHSANPVGSKRIAAAMQSADRFWDLYEDEFLQDND